MANPVHVNLLMKWGTYIWILQVLYLYTIIEHFSPSSFSSNTGGLLEVLAPIVKSTEIWTFHLHYSRRNIHLHSKGVWKPQLGIWEIKRKGILMIWCTWLQTVAEIKLIWTTAVKCFLLENDNFRNNRTSNIWENPLHGLIRSGPGLIKREESKIFF